MANLVFNIFANVVGAVAGVRQFSNAVAATGPAADNASNQATSAFDRMDKILGKARSAVIGFIAAFVFTRVIRGLKDIVDAGIEFETAFAGIRKTVDATDAEFAKLSDQLRQMAKEIPIGATELAKIGEIAGQLGIPAKEIGKFTEMIAKIGLTTNLSVEEAATNFARFANIMGVPISSMQAFAGVVVRLGNEFAANEQEILAFSMNLAGAGKLIGLSTSQVAALATALASSGLHAEKAGSSMSRIMIEIQKATEKGGNELVNFAKVAGGVNMTAEQFAKIFKEDASQAILMFLGGLDKLSKSGQGTIGVLDALHLGEIRVRDVALRSAAAYGVYADAMRAATDEETKHGSALEIEFAKRMQTARAELDKAIARLRDIAITLSGIVTPAIVSSSKAFAQFAESTLDFVRTYPGLVQAFTAIAVSIAALRLASAVIAVDAVRSAFLGLWIAVGSGGSVLTTIASGLAAVVTPFALLATSIAAAGALLIATANAFEAEAAAVMDAEKAQNTYQITLNNSISRLEQLGIAVKEKTLAGVQAAEQELATRQWFEGVEDDLHNKRMARIDIESDKAQKEAIEQRERLAKLANHLRGVESELEAPISRFFNMIDTGVEIAEVRLAAVVPPKLLSDLEMIDVAMAGINATTKKAAEDEFILADARSRDAEAFKKSQDEIADKNEKVFNKMKEHAEHIFDIIVKKGKGFSAAFAAIFLTAGREITSSFIASLLTPFKAAFDTLFDTIAGSTVGKFIKGLRDKLIGGISSALASGATSMGATVVGGSNMLPGMFGLGSAGAGMSIGGIGGTAGTTAGAGAGMVGGGSSLIGLATNPYTIAIAGAVAATWAVIKSQAHHEANRFVKDFQNPFGTALSSIVDSFNIAAASGTLTKEAAQSARDSVADLWKGFKDQTEQFAKGGSDEALVAMQAMNTMTSIFGENLSGLLGDMDETIASLKNLSAVAEYTNKVLKAADGWDSLEQAIQELMDTGMDWAAILEFLGGDVESMAKAMRLLGIAIPPAMQSILDTIDAQELLQKRIDRLKEVEEELAEVRQRTADAIIRKMDYLDAQINKSAELIEKWRNSIKDINKDIDDSKRKLSDAKYWQKEYASAIKEASDATTNATEIRVRTEERIEQLETEIQRANLERHLEWARSTEDAILIAQAESALKVFDNEQREKDFRSKVAELDFLKTALPERIANELAAKAAMEAAKRAAEESIATKQQELQDFIASKEEERRQLELNIKSEEDRIDILKEDLRFTGQLLDILGVKRESELGAMNASIGALIGRGIQLETERQQLSILTGTAAATTNVFGLLGNAFTSASNAALAAIAALTGASQATVFVPTASIVDPGPSGGAAAPGIVTGAINNIQQQLESLGLGALFGMPGFAHGSDSVPHDMMAMVHAGEEIRPAWKNRSGDGSPSVVTYAPTVQVSLHMSGNSDKQSTRRWVRDEVIPEILDAMEINSSRITNRMARYLSPHQQDGAEGKSTPRMIIK